MFWTNKGCAMTVQSGSALDAVTNKSVERANNARQSCCSNVAKDLYKRAWVRYEIAPTRGSKRMEGTV